MWLSPAITLRWPDYFKPDSDDDAKIVKTAIDAHEAKLITKRAAVQKIQRTFGIENVDQFLLALDEEAAERKTNAPAFTAPTPQDNAPPPVALPITPQGAATK